MFCLLVKLLLYLFQHHLCGALASIIYIFIVHEFNSFYLILRNMHKEERLIEYKEDRRVALTAPSTVNAAWRVAMPSQEPDVRAWPTEKNLLHPCRCNIETLASQLCGIHQIKI